MDILSGRCLPRPARGFTLVEIVVVLFILGIVISMAVAITSALTASQRISNTTTRLTTIDTAIVQFVMQQKRLPCPADGRLASGVANAGVERRDGVAQTCNVNGANTVQHGVVPWVTLGLSETDATDGWNRRFTYRVAKALVADSSLDMSWCDPAGTEAGAGPSACNTACTSTVLTSCTPPTKFLNTKGLEVHDSKGTGTKIMDPNAAPSTGAAYVVISAGSTGGGAYTGAGQVVASTTADGNEEAKNYANLALQAYYVDDSISDAAGVNTHFDDIVSRPALMTVINKAALGPRSH
jgi:prepilin-type N-terminal cleavage/methylation domain-containing protein